MPLLGPQTVTSSIVEFTWILQKGHSLLPTGSKEEAVLLPLPSKNPLSIPEMTSVNQDQSFPLNQISLSRC